MKWEKNIKIRKSITCTGCTACASICPVNAISMKMENGFLYPVINNTKCIECALCKKICPVERENKDRVSEFYIVQNRNKEQRLKSQSGGLFAALAEEILQGGELVLV